MITFFEPQFQTQMKVSFSSSLPCQSQTFSERAVFVAQRQALKHNFKHRRTSQSYGTQDNLTKTKKAQVITQKKTTFILHDKKIPPKKGEGEAVRLCNFYTKQCFLKSPLKVRVTAFLFQIYIHLVQCATNVEEISAKNKKH